MLDPGLTNCRVCSLQDIALDPTLWPSGGQSKAARVTLEVPLQSKAAHLDWQIGDSAPKFFRPSLAPAPSNKSKSQASSQRPPPIPVKPVPCSPLPTLMLLLYTYPGCVPPRTPPPKASLKMTICSKRKTRRSRPREERSPPASGSVTQNVSWPKSFP